MMKATGCPGLRRPLGYFPMALLFPALCSSGAELRRKDCQYPDAPAHTTYRCLSPSCQLSLGGRAFRAGSKVQHFCEAGYIQAGQPAVSVCRGGQWRVLKSVVCEPLAGPPVPHSRAIIAVTSIPMVAAASVTASALLLVAMMCVLLRPKACRYRCWRWYEPMEESEVSTVDGDLVPLPSYEEAVYGSRGGPGPPSPPAAMPHVLSGGLDPPAEADEPWGRSQATSPPPSYQESQAAAVSSSDAAQPTAPPDRFLLPVAGKERCR
ncbi:sushi domain-containing protein 6-like [Emydura macquarii macquarii]|uniref:sushi domain-containing protein 6-like n=1 Tax=Emydura macquarii macquarii TaxID=1129001 RepID=UPI00352A1729